MQSKYFIPPIKEYSNPYVVLDADKRFTDDELRIVETEFKDKMDIIPRSEGRYEIKTQEFVGYIVLPNHVITIIPKIPGISFFNMIRYALNLPLITPEEFKMSEENNYYDILVHFFLDELERILQRGLFTGYKNYDENLSCIRGKILFKEQVNVNYNRSDKIYCDYSEVSPDIIENRIIKYTLHYLSQCYFPNEELNSKLLQYYRRVDEVELVPVSRQDLSIEYTPLNEHYRTIIGLCALFLSDASLDQEKIGERTAISFLINMNRLFESFVANILSDRLVDYEVQSQKEIASTVKGNPTKVILDLLITKDNRPMLILDTKYHEFDGKPENDHVYQLYYYSSNTHIKNCCLIYPGTHEVNGIPQEQGILLHIVLLNLAASNQTDFDRNCDKFIATISNTLLSIARDPRMSGVLKTSRAAN